MFSEKNEASEAPSRFGMKRSPGVSKLRPQVIQDDQTASSSKMIHSISMANLNRKIVLPQDVSTPQSKQRLQRTKTATGPLKLDYSCDTPIRSKPNIFGTPLSTIKNIEVTPPNIDTKMKKSSSGTMLLRQTPERLRRLEEDGETPRKLRRAGSVPKIVGISEFESPKKLESSDTPALKRKRTNSASLLPSSPTSKIGLTSPTQRRPKELSVEPRSPTKKRLKNDTPKTSPRKYFSLAKIEMNLLPDTPVINLKPISPLKRNKSSIVMDYSKLEEKKPIVPEVKHQPSSSDTFHSAVEYVVTKEVYLTPKTSFEEEMRPLIKKQISVNEQVAKEKLEGEEIREKEEDEDEGFGDSMKTIKRGQGSMLARSVSLKLSAPPKKPEKSIAETEKASSTSAIPSSSASSQIIRKSSSTFRFRVSPSTLCLKVDPSTSVTPITPKVQETPKKSVLRMIPRDFTPKPETGEVNRVNKVQFDRLDVFYFERNQGEDGIPEDKMGVALGMDNKHHSKRQFILKYGGGRPNLSLELCPDGELSDGEVVAPDSDDEDPNYAAKNASNFNKIDLKERIRILSESGVTIVPTQKTRHSSERKPKWGCNCKNGECQTETCECLKEGINCQKDGDDVPCECDPKKCGNPNGILVYDLAKVHEYRLRTIMNYNASIKAGIDGSPKVTKFIDSDDEKEEEDERNNPVKYPVTPIYSRRSRSNLSDIRENSSGENNIGIDRFEELKELKELENDVCVEEKQNEQIDEILCPSSSSSSSLASSQENLGEIENAPIIEQLPNLVVSQ